MTQTGKRQRRKFGRIRQFNSGRWQASYTGPDGRVYIAPKTFNAKIDAEAWLTDRRREIDRQLWSPASGQEDRPGAPFGEYAEGWLKQRGIKDRTRAHYRKLLDNHILATFADTDLRDITPAAVRRWYATTAVGTPTMRAHSYSLLRAIMQTALADDLIDSNPCRISGASTARRVHKIRPATLDELETITKAMPDPYQAFVLMAAWLAMRYGELTELRRKDIDLHGEVARVRRAVVRVGEGFKVTTPKSDAGSARHKYPATSDTRHRRPPSQTRQPRPGVPAVPIGQRPQPSPSTLGAVPHVLQGPKSRRPTRLTGARPSTLRRRVGCIHRRHTGRTDAAARTQHSRRRTPLPARRQGPGPRNRRTVKQTGREPGDVMMADAVKYVVMCNCDDEPGALIIAWIDDERPAGGHIQMRSNTRFTETQWGRHIEWKLECRACRKYAPISEMTAAAILDGFGAKLHELRTSTIPDADDPSIAEARHVIPFSALCLRLSQLGG